MERVVSAPSHKPPAAVAPVAAAGARPGYDRCRCRPGCLAPVMHGDDVVLLHEGYAVVEHALDAYPAEQLTLDDVELDEDVAS
jgi:hypothetical protein